MKRRTANTTATTAEARRRDIANTGRPSPDDPLARFTTRPSGLPGSRLSKEKRHDAYRLLVLVWLVVGAVAAGQRGYFTHASQNCASAGTIAVAVIAGPLNYFGATPQ